MEALLNYWHVGAMIICFIVGYLIKRFGLGSKIADMANKINDVGEAVNNLREEVCDAFKPDEDGNVKLTPEELEGIYNALDDLLMEFDIDLPDWESQDAKGV